MSVKAEQVIIIHQHIYKNAGSSFIKSAKLFFGESRVLEIEPSNLQKFFSHEDLENLVRQYSHVVVISSHRIQLPLPQFLCGKRVIVVSFLRDPIKRLASIYKFERSSAIDHSSVSHLSRLVGFNDYINILLMCGYKDQISNTQSKFILNGPEYSDYEMRSYSEEGVIFGLVENYRGSLRKIEEHLKLLIPGINLSYAHENASPEPVYSGSHVFNLVSDLDPETKITLEKINSVDFRVLKYVEDNFQNGH